MIKRTGWVYMYSKYAEQFLVYFQLYFLTTKVFGRDRSKMTDRKKDGTEQEGFYNWG